MKPCGSAADEVGQVHVFGGFLNVGVGNPVGAQANVALDRASKQKRILQHHAESAAKRGQVHVFHVHAVDSDGAFLHVIEAQQQRNDRGLAGAGMSDDGYGFSRLDGERNVAENPVRLGGVA